MKSYERPVSEQVTEQRLLDEVTQISCEAIDDGIVVYEEYSSSYGHFPKVHSNGELIILTDGAPEDCPLRKASGRRFEDFAKSCGSCSLANFIF